MKKFLGGFAVGVIATLIAVAVIAPRLPREFEGQLLSATEEHRLQGMLVRAVHAKEPIPLQGAFRLYKEAEILKEAILEDPIGRLVLLDTTMNEVNKLQDIASQRFIDKLTECLRSKKFPPEPLYYKEIFPGGSGYFNHCLEVKDSYAIAQEIQRIADEHPDVRYDYRACRRAILEYVAQEGPEFRTHWLKHDQGGWGDSAGCLSMFLTDDYVPPSKLGLSAQETYRLLEMAGS